MKVAVVGAGAMGGVWAALLASAGNDVTVVDVAPTIIATILAQGLTVERKGGSRESVLLKATSAAEDVGPVDLVFFFVKAQHTAAAALSARPMVTESTTVVSLQNGWGNADVLAGCYAAEQIVIGVTYHSATVLAPAVVGHTGSGPTFVGPYVDGGALARSAVVARCLEAADIQTQSTPQVKTEVWRKLILNAGTLPTAALTRLRAGQLGEPGAARDLVDALAIEAVQVARAQGYAIDAAERIDRIHATLAGAGAGKPSMLQDVENGRKTEIEVINGAVVRAAKQVGVEVPLNQAMVALIGGLERAHGSPA